MQKFLPCTCVVSGPTGHKVPPGESVRLAPYSFELVMPVTFVQCACDEFEFELGAGFRARAPSLPVECWGLQAHRSITLDLFFPGFALDRMPERCPQE